MAGNSKIASSWSDLPNELVEKIANCFDTETDVLRFRAICSPWRSATTPFQKFLPSSLKLPFPFAAAAAAAGETAHQNHDGAYFTLTERTVYRVQPPDCKDIPNFWLLKTETSNDGKLRILNPLSDHEIKILPENQIPKVLNTLDFRVSEVCKSYALRYVNPSNPIHNCDHKFAKKVAVSASVENNSYAIMAIDENNSLWYIKSGDEKWTIVTRGDYYNYRFCDIMNYKGLFRGIDTSGRTWYFNSTLEVTGTSYFRLLTASKRHFVEVSDELFLIEEVTDKDKRVCTTCDDPEIGCQCNFPRTPIKNTNVEIVISKTDITGADWVDAKKTIAKLMGRVIFVGDDCSFSVPAEWVKGPLVFYTDRYIYFRTEEEKKTYVYDEVLEAFYEYDDDDDSDCGYNQFECDCCVSSDDGAARVDTFVPRDDVKVKFRGLHGHNSGVYDFQTRKLGSLLMFPECANVFWPPPAWLNRN